MTGEINKLVFDDYLVEGNLDTIMELIQFFKRPVDYNIFCEFMRMMLYDSRVTVDMILEYVKRLFMIRDKKTFGSMIPVRHRTIPEDVNLYHDKVSSLAKVGFFIDAIIDPVDRKLPQM